MSKKCEKFQVAKTAYILVDEKKRKMYAIYDSATGSERLIGSKDADMQYTINGLFLNASHHFEKELLELLSSIDYNDDKVAYNAVLALNSCFSSHKLKKAIEKILESK